MKNITYHFEEAEQCEMCGDPSDNHHTLGQRLNRSQGLRPKRKAGISVSVVQCAECGLVYAQPMPIPTDIQAHYGVAPEEYWTEDLDYTPDYFMSQIETVKELLPFAPGMTALDIGVGVGRGMTSMINAGFDTFGIEPSTSFYERAVSKMRIRRDRLKPVTLEDAEYDGESFDFIAYRAVFEHLYHPALSLKKTLDWLKPGGIIYIEVPSSKYTVTRLFNLYFKLIGTNYTAHISPMHSPFHLYEFTLKSFKELGKKLNYEIVKHQTDVGTFYYVPTVLQPALRKYMRVSDTGMQITVYLRKT